MTDSVTPDSIHCFKVILANHLDSDPFLYMKEFALDSIQE